MFYSKIYYRLTLYEETLSIALIFSCSLHTSG